MRDDRKHANKTIARRPVTSWLSMVRTNADYRKEDWIDLLESPVQDIVIVSTETEARFAEEAGHAAVIVEDEISAIVFVTTVETLMSEGYFIPPLLLLTQSATRLTATEKLLFLSLAEKTPMELVLAEIPDSSLADLIDFYEDTLGKLLNAASRRIMEEEYGA